MNDDSFSKQNISFESINDSSGSIQLDQNQISKKMKAIAFFKTHLLNPYFKEWHFISIQRKKMQELEIKFIRWQIENIQYIFFIKWTNAMTIRNKLHKLGSQLLISKHFFLWINFIQAQNLDKYHYRQVIITRRRIYNQNFFRKWRHALILKRKYELYSSNEEKIFCKKIIKAFRLTIEKNKKFEEICQYLQKIRCHGMLIQWYNNWRYSRMTRYVQRNHNFFLKQSFYNKWYDCMKLKVGLRRKYRYIYNIHKQQLLQKLFDLWYYKHFRLNDIQDKFERLSNLTRIHIKAAAFDKLYSAYNYKLYLLQTEENLSYILDTIRKKHYLSLWAIRAFKKYRFTKAIRDTIITLNRHRLNYTFHKWKAKFTIINHYQMMIKKVKYSYRKITLRHYLLQWYSEYRYLINNKTSLQKAIMFRSICLKLKSFRAFQSNVKYKKIRNDQKNRMNFLIRIIYFYKWKRRYMKYKRRFILISAVLKNWALTVQRKMIDRWISYIHMKRQRENEYLKAQLVYEQCKVAFTIDSFVAGCPKIPENQNKIDDLPIPIFPEICNITDNFLNESVPIKLNEPKIPSFMRNQTSPKRDINSHLKDFEIQFQELAKKCEEKGSDANDRARMLFLIQEMNKIRSNLDFS